MGEMKLRNSAVGLKSEMNGQGCGFCGASSPKPEVTLRSNEISTHYLP